MEPQFQNTFIPKKPGSAVGTGIPTLNREVRRPKHHNVFVSISFLIFLVVALIAGAVFGYQQYLLRQIQVVKAGIERDIIAMQDDFLDRMLILDSRLKSAKEILSTHVVATPIFSIIQELTLPSVQFTEFAYDHQPNGVTLNLKGRAVNYAAVTLQSDLFAESPYFVDPIFYDLDADDSGRVEFAFRTQIHPDFITYDQLPQ